MNYKLIVLISVFFSLMIDLQAQDSLQVVSDVQLISDGENGVDTYELIESVFGAGCIEAPDLYSVNHPGNKHIVEATDDFVGNHFVFKIHKNDDGDRDTGKTDRQRNEIKTYANSANTLKGFKGETMRFHWFFKLQEGFSISKNFSHFFQLKAVDGDDSQPIATISGSINSNHPEFEIIYSNGSGTSDQQLTHTNWSVANTGEWMEMEAIARFDDKGYLKITVSDLYGNELMKVERNNIDLWRTGSTFVRPKWGIYRSLNSKSYLSDDEETAGFANFSVQKLQNKTGLKRNPAQNIPELTYTNPVNKYLIVSFLKEYSGEVQILDFSGKLLLKKAYDRIHESQFDLDWFSPGIYVIKFDNSIAPVSVVKL